MTKQNNFLNIGNITTILNSINTPWLHRTIPYKSWIQYSMGHISNGKFLNRNSIRNIQLL